jgi:C4-dicarboxylate-specific signal transduction histidine kinase
MDNLEFIFSGIRHEIGNPLNSVKMALSVLSMNMDRYSQETIREFVNRAMGEVSRVEYLLKALKNFSMFETLDVEPVHMGRFMNNFKALVETDFTAKGGRIHVQMPEQPVIALTDHRAFHQVMLNLLTNAADALQEQETPRLDIIVTRSCGFVQVQVKDNGCGISEDERHNLFQPFFTSKPRGTGLGLVIVKKMLSKMNGTVSIDSVFQEGTTVTMTLPEGPNQTINSA